MLNFSLILSLTSKAWPKPTEHQTAQYTAPAAQKMTVKHGRTGLETRKTGSSPVLSTHKKFWNQTILELFPFTFRVKKFLVYGWQKMQLQCDLAGGVPALAARVLNMQIRCRFETSSVFFVYCGAGNIHQGDTISNHSSLRDSYKSSPTGGT